ASGRGMLSLSHHLTHSEILRAPHMDFYSFFLILTFLHLYLIISTPHPIIQYIAQNVHIYEAWKAFKFRRALRDHHTEYLFDPLFIVRLSVNLSERIIPVLLKIFRKILICIHEINKF